jgi:putative phosphoribosyl transferase
VTLSARSRDTRDVTIGSLSLAGTLGMPKAAMGIVLFAHGSGSGRFSSRNNFVAGAMRKAGLATLLLDLLTEEEAQDRRNVFDIRLLAERLLMATAWVKQEPDTSQLPACYFGASTGAAAALVAAASGACPVGAIVSRGGRPDLTGVDLARVSAPTLLIVGGADPEVLDLNRAALAELRCEKKLVVVPGATHLFEEPGALETVVDLAGDWFASHLARVPA